MPNRRLSKLLFTVLLIVSIGGFLWYYFSYHQLKDEVDLLSDPVAQQEIYEQEVEDILSKVGRHIVLPADEIPELATIQDAEALAAEQAFFEGAINGDKLLVFSQKALLYSPSRDILVNVGPIYVGDFSELVVDIRNGSDMGGAANELGSLLAEKFNYDVINVGDAVDFDYEETVLVNLGEVDVSILEQELGVMAVTELPSGEAASEAEVVIIIGGGAVEEVAEEAVEETVVRNEAAEEAAEEAVEEAAEEAVEEEAAEE